MTKSLFLNQYGIVHNYKMFCIWWCGIQSFQSLESTTKWFTYTDVDRNSIKDLKITTKRLMKHDVDSN